MSWPSSRSTLTTVNRPVNEEDSDTIRPIWITSGDVLPRLLLDKLQQYPPADDVPDDFLSNILPSSIQESRSAPSRASQLESMIERTTQALEGIQKQIQRGEEVYYEETYGFGNLFTGFDGELDARGDNSYNSSSNNNALRRMPNDARWFSLPLRVYPPLPPAAITNDVPVTVETIGSTKTAEASPSPAKQRTPAAVAFPKKDEPSVKMDESPKPDESEPDESDVEPEEKEETVKEKVEVRETRSKRKAAAPPPVRRTKRKRR